jgi:spermidine synthase
MPGKRSSGIALDALRGHHGAQRAPDWFLVPVLAGILFLSGIAALVYQVLWLRLLSLTFGVTVYAASTVLTSFMAGLALGSAGAGRVADRSRNPLRLFGLVELSIGLCAVCTPFALDAVHHLYGEIFRRLPDVMPIATAVRFALSFAVLIVPTALMGATLPLIMKSSLTRLDRLATRVSLLYGSNTAGAIAGALAAGFYLIPEVGLGRSFLLAASINALVGAIAIACSYALPPNDAAAAASPSADGAAADAGVTRAARSIVLAVFVLSGFASLALEVVWFRVLAIVVGPTSYAFTLMLAAVLAGIAIGSWLITPLMRLRLNWLLVLAGLQIGAALVALQSFSTLRRPPRIPGWLDAFGGSLAMGHLVPAVVATAAAILPTAILFGLAFPVGLRLWADRADDRRRTAERIGVFYSLNVFGGILGSIASGFALLPLLTSHGSLIALAALFLLSGIALVAAVPIAAAVRVAIAAVAAVVFVASARDVPSIEAFGSFRQGRPIMFHREGVQTTVTVFGGPGTGNRALHLDGRHQANDSPSMAFIHRRIGLLPAVLHPSPRRALVVGLGGGATAGALSQYPGLQVEVVELSEGVLEAAALFSHVNFDVMRQPNVRARVDDGRDYLARVTAPYDIITADAIIPTHAGATSVYSVEYFRLVRRALAPGGIALHWNGGGSDEEYGLILRAFARAFPYTTLWGDAKLMVGSAQPILVSRRRIERMLQDDAMRRVLGLMNVETFDHLERMFRASPEQVQALAGPGPYLTDDRPIVEYFATPPPGAGVSLAGVRGDIASVLRP